MFIYVYRHSFLNAFTDIYDPSYGSIKLFGRCCCRVTLLIFFPVKLFNWIGIDHWKNALGRSVISFIENNRKTVTVKDKKCKLNSVDTEREIERKLTTPKVWSLWCRVVFQDNMKSGFAHNHFLV